MDISARAISLTDRPQRGHVGHQCSHAPGRPILHRRLILSQTSAGKGIDYVTDSLLAVRCSFVRAWRPFLRPDLRGQRCAARRDRQGWPSRLPCPSLPCCQATPCMRPFKSSDIFAAFFTFFIPVSLFDLESRFFAPTHMCWKSTRAGGCQGRPSLCAGLRSIVSRPSLDSPEHVGTLVVVGMTRPRGARCRGTIDSRRNLVSGGSQ
jgi:hypothetical protein